ncbi:MAG: hypothetical protein PWR27_1292 [Petroclostridium sp.]|jgi:uncharacterized membrane protein YheB (UPF0754 family)|uniref:DUF445 domain-containing protein n=1 Tax=Petroclostridium xylanilyticum TaxID=1792311 RepID=UPI000B9816F1|nr:DUF445 family protein [Petroclostridium xylanilyticum]MDK2810583.1 hypothetical protein [Petroclostridium sp.]
MNSAYVTAPLVGALIGYITNFIAIKMLFKPLEAKYIFGIRIPFTPGIIPREKARLARSIGIAVGEKLLTDEIIIDTLTSPYFHQKIEQFIDQKLAEVQHSNKTLTDVIHYLLDDAESENILINIQKDVADFLYQKINSPEVMEKISLYISQSLVNYIEKQSANPLIKMALGFNKGIIDSIIDIITGKIKELLYTDSRAVIESLVQDEIQGILNLEIGNLSQKASDKIPEIREMALNIFNRIIKNNIRTVTALLDIPSIVERRINDFDILEVEQLILSVVDKELKAIIWLGALLGLIMGFLMPLFS